MKDPIQELMDEHRIIEKLLSALEAGARQDLPLGFYEKAVALITSFADACHHGKEEAHLFPLLEQRGIPREMGPVGVMLAEHEEGRHYVANMQDLLRMGDLEGLRREAAAYAALMRGHIDKEDHALFPMAVNVLSQEDRISLRGLFDGVPRPDGLEAQVDALLAELEVRT